MGKKLQIIQFFNCKNNIDQWTNNYENIVNSRNTTAKEKSYFLGFSDI